MTKVIDRVTGWLFLAIFFLFPFQKKNKIFRSFANSTIPEDAHFPDFFSTSIYYYFTDVLILVFAGLCLYRYRHRLVEFFFYGPARFLIILTVIGLFSISQSMTPTYPLHYIRLFQFFLGVLFFCSSVAILRTQNREKLLLQVFWVFFATGMVESAISITQYFLQDNVGLKWLGESSIKTFMFPMETGKRWMIDSLFDYSTGNPFLLRACGTLGHPNILGGFLFFSLMSTYFLFLRETKLWMARLLQGGVFILLCALCLSFSRSAIIATLGGTMLWGGVVCYQHFFVCRSCEVRKCARLGLTVMISLAICLTLFYSQFFYRGGIVGSNEVVKGADSERIVYQRMSMEMVKEAPLLGVGFNQFQLHSQKFAPTEYPYALHSKVHNIYLLVFSEMGLCGMVAFCSFLFVFVKGFWQSAKVPLFLASFSLLIGLLFIGICDFYLIDGIQGRILFFGACLLVYSQMMSHEQSDKVLAFIAKKR